MCQALFSGILRLKGKLDTFMAPKSLQFQRGKGENILMKNTDSSQNVACTLREHRRGRPKEGDTPSGWRQLGRKKTYQGTGGPEALGNRTA